MKIFGAFLLAAGLLLISANLAAQNDPFAETNPKGDDPFALTESEQATDPFAEHSNQGKIECNEVNERIRETLSHCTTQTFDETPLIEAIREIGEAHNIRIVVNGRALETIGLSKEEPVTISLKNVSLRSFLRLMLDVHDLTYVIRNEVLTITTIESAEQDLELRTYSLSEPMGAKSEEVVSALQKTVMPNAWDEQGGPASAVPILGKVLVVSATESLHEKVQDFLDKIDAALDQP